jgi:hypothetical protein|tara:strand:- start:227 stop:502 length:276 start_codon:yes stop_codon:yes gene_type:complete
MAVKEKTKNKTLKFEDKDLNTLQVLQKDTDRITYNLGQLSIQKERILQTEIQLKEELKKLDQRETEVGKEFSTKYGVGNVDINTGDFTPSK